MGLRKDEIHTMPREKYAEFAFNQHQRNHNDDSFCSMADLDTFRALWDNHHSMMELPNGDIVSVKIDYNKNA